MLSNLKFVPKHKPCAEEYINKFKKFIQSSSSIFILTGAGVSTESGIPDYRSEGVGLYFTSNKRPVQFKDFMKSAAIRQSYWARNYIGWPRFSSFLPNTNHLILAEWEKKMKVQCIVTQNVDRLHHKAGSKVVTELHGSAYEVVCMTCSLKLSRHEFQKELKSFNKGLEIESQIIRPDGDVELTKEQVENFLVPPCQKCGGILKPQIVFFGDSVPKTTVEEVKCNLRLSDAVLVLGSSLSVYSAYRHILSAVEFGLPIALVNIGQTRADKHIKLKLPFLCSEVLSKITL